MANLTSTLTVALVDDVSKPARSVADALKTAEGRIKDVAKAMANTGATDRFTASLSKLKLSATDIEAVSSAWKNYATSAGLAADASKWTSTQTAGVRRWEQANISALRAVKREQEAYARSAAQAARQAAVPGATSRPGAGVTALPISGKHAAVGVGAYVGAHAIEHGAKTAIERAREADDSSRYQKAIADLTEDERKSRLNQSIRLAGTSGLKPVDILKAQETLAGRGVKAQFVEPFTEQLVSFSRAMKVSMEDAARTLETIVFSTNQTVDDAATAGKVMQRQIDIAVKAAKMGGLSGDDIRAGIKFGGASAHGAGFKNETILAILATLSRAGYHGDEAGVAARGISSKLVSPTAKGLDALNALGINFNDYTKMPGGLSADNMNMSVKRKLGMSLSKSQLARISALNEKTDENGDALVGNREGYISAASDVINESMPKNKKGQIAAKDRAKVAKMVGDFYKQAVESVDVEGLLRAILAAHPTLAQANGIVTSQHGGKLLAMSEKMDVFDEIVKSLSELKAGFAQEIAGIRSEGLSGALDRAEASIDAFALRVGTANETLIKLAADVAQKAAQGANGLSDGAIQGGTVGGGILAGALSLKALQSFAEGGLKGLVGNAGGLLKFGAKWAGWIGAAMAIGEVLSEYGPKMIGDPDHPVKDDPLNRMHERNKPTSLEELRRQRDEHDKVLREHGVGGPQLDTAEVERKAQELKEAATVQGVVTMDHSEVDAASAAVRTLIGLIGQANLGFGQIKAGAASAAASAGMVGVLGKTQRGHFATSGPSGEGQ